MTAQYPAAAVDGRNDQDRHIADVEVAVIGGEAADLGTVDVVECFVLGQVGPQCRETSLPAVLDPLPAGQSVELLGEGLGQGACGVRPSLLGDPFADAEFPGHRVGRWHRSCVLVQVSAQCRVAGGPAGLLPPAQLQAGRDSRAATQDI